MWWGHSQLAIDEGDVEVRGASVTTVDRSDDGLSIEQTVMSEHIVELYLQSVSHLSDDADKEKVKKLLTDYQDVFSKGMDDLGKTDIVHHSIRVDETTPIHQRARRLPLWQRAEADEQVREMVQKGIIEPSSSPCASPVVQG